MSDATSFEQREHRRFFEWASLSPLCLPAERARQHYHERSVRASNAVAFVKEETLGLSRLRTAARTLCQAPLDREVVLGRSAAELISLIAAGIAFSSSRRTVVIAEPCHPCVRLAWLGLAEPRGMRIVVVAEAPGHYVDQRAVETILRSESCVAVCMTHVDHLHGTEQPIRAISKLTAQHGAYLIVDGAQAVGRIEVDLSATLADAYVGVGRKGLRAPLGTAFLIATASLLAHVQPLVWSTRSAWLRSGAAELTEVPRRFEGALPDLAALVALTASIEALLDQDVLSGLRQTVSDLLPKLAGDLVDAGLHAQSDVSPGGNAGIVTFTTPPHIDGLHLQQHLLSQGYVVAATADSIRVSLHLDNDLSSIRGLTQQVRQYVAAA